MCGLTFIHDDRDDRGTLLSRAALEMLTRRGPDAVDLLTIGKATLGHRRLAIVDVEGNRQPLRSPDGRFVLAFNGEIYNHGERRLALKSRWSFNSRGDTEVLLATLLLDGPIGLNALDGMWAFALWDTQTETLLLGRDRMGKKPLYFAPGEDRFAAASELPALRLLDGTRWTEDLDSTADYLRYGHPLPGHTFFTEVMEVLPGHLVTWRRGTPFQSAPWWRPPLPGSFVGRRAEVGEALRHAFGRSVRNRLVADVEVGAFLSGGIDSSLVVAEAAGALSRPLKTFSVGFTQMSFDESRFAARVAKQFHTDHHVTRLERFDEQQLETLLDERMGQPFADPSLLPTALVAESAAHHVKVALSGDGADEMFSGYQRYQAAILMRWYARAPRVLRTSFEALLRRLPENDVHHSRSLLKKAQMFATLAQRKTMRNYVAPEFFSPGEFTELAPHLETYGHSVPHIDNVETFDDLARMMRMDALVYLPQDILVKVDRATMHHSLESRAPFLGKDVVELAMSLPAAWHRGAVSGKRLLRETFKDMLPAAIWTRRKQGFSVPVSTWFRGELGERLLEDAMNDAGPLRVEAVRNMLKLHRERERDMGLPLWLIYTYLRWRQRAA